MVTRTFTIYEVPNSYVTSGGTVTISNTFSMNVTDDDGFLDGTAGSDTGAVQGITVDGGSINGYQFFYNDNIRIGGNTESVKTFQLTINGTTRSFIMNDTGSSIPGADVGVSIRLSNYTSYTPIDYNDLPCFVRGTQIETLGGLCLIEDLAVGDLVSTLDQGPQPIRWIGSSVLTARDLIAKPEMRPIEISANSFGKGLPQRNLRVSPQHRCMLGGWSVELNFGEDQMLAPAKSLLGRTGVTEDLLCIEVEYFHLMFDAHQIIYSEGLPTESFLVGDTIRDGMDQDQLREILALFPELEKPAGSPVNEPARPILRNFEVQVLEGLVA